jgi:hypothetical protein
MLRIDVNATVRANRFLSVLAEVRSENGESPHPYGVYVRLRPWPKRAFDIQAGRIPPTFGAFARRTYANDNILIGYPLAYQYLTSLRPTRLPANADELLQMRGRRVALEFFRWQPDQGSRRAGRLDLSMGHRRPGPCRGVVDRRLRRRHHGLTRQSIGWRRQRRQTARRPSGRASPGRDSSSASPPRAASS